MTAFDQLVRTRILPVVTVDEPRHAHVVAQALLAGGIDAAEFTLRTPYGLEAISQTAEIAGFTTGAGTVTTPEHVTACVERGARFIVSPGFDPSVVARAHELGVPVLPGVATATEVQAAIRHGLDVVKLFPAEQLGGLDMINALRGPFPDLRFIPSGGVTADNARTYVSHPGVPCVSGSWMVPRDAVATGDTSRIEALTRDALGALTPAAP